MTLHVLIIQMSLKQHTKLVPVWKFNKCYFPRPIRFPNLPQTFHQLFSDFSWTYLWFIDVSTYSRPAVTWISLAFD